MRYGLEIKWLLVAGATMVKVRIRSAHSDICPTTVVQRREIHREDLYYPKFNPLNPLTAYSCKN